MKLAFFSDVHGNLEALELFIEHSRNLGTEAYACLGDSIGYGPNPNECLEIIREICHSNVIMGNHEYAALNLMESERLMNPMAFEAICWTQKQLTRNNIKYIGGLKLKLETELFTLTHASCFEPDSWEYLFSGRSLGIMLCLQNSGTSLTFAGHTHRPMLADASGKQLIETTFFEGGTTYSNRASEKLLINPGSIGQPRDPIHKPCYVTLDTESQQITWWRLDGYDPKITAAKILKTDLPCECAYYLTR